MATNELPDRSEERKEGAGRELTPRIEDVSGSISDMYGGQSLKERMDELRGPQEERKPRRGETP
jgi:hypothetical protein